MAISESRAAAASTHFRVQSPNSQSRRIKIVGLGDGGGRIAQAIGERGLGGVDIVNTGGYVIDSANAMVKGSTGDDIALHRQLEEANIIFIVAVNGDQVGFARVVSRIARDLGKLVTGVLVEERGRQSAKDAATLDTLRACADMLVIGSDENYLDEMLNQLGATAA